MTTEGRLWILAGVIAVLALLYTLGPILTPFIISALLAWLGDPVADRLEAWKFPRGLAVTMVFFATFIIIALLVLLVGPMIGHEVTAITTRAPKFYAWYTDIATPWLATHLHVEPSRLRLERLSGVATENFANAGALASNTFTAITHSGKLIFTAVISILLVPVITFYWLRDWDIFKARVASLLPRDHKEAICSIAVECEGVLAAFFRGQLLVMASLAVIYSIGLTAVGLEGGIAVGVIAGLLSFVPYLGISIGVLLGLSSAVLQDGDGWLPLWVLIVFAVGHGMEGFVLTPRLVGGRIGLHPVLVIFTILAGGELFGFVGVLLALPVAAAGTVFVRHAQERYLQSDIYRGDQSDLYRGDGGGDGESG
ncbi:MAG TPA: AI-2E family transporter [Gammaproteobacteria bacterium]|jgi:predicted PurR-regulated permease PerM|nr:AI-2E family transporter [Gammaproteobacteria bacterium]